MQGELQRKGIKVVAEGNVPVKINYLISDAGGQGDVYHVTFGGQDYAMKWYCKHDEDVIGGLQYNIISRICGEDKRPAKQFIWPLFLVTEENPCNGKEFGYLMELLPKNYYEMSDYFRMDGDAKAVRFKTYNALLVAGMKIAHCMQQLHLKGYVCTDFSPSDIVINPETGDVIFIGSDMICVNGEPGTVRGRLEYVAPEIPRSKHQMSPNVQTDYYSLAIILYRLFFVDHPMEGKLFEKMIILTSEIEESLFAINPVFHFNPQDDSNRPTEYYAPNAPCRWKVMPQELKMLFLKAFTEGIDHPERRDPDGVWISTIAKCRDKLILLNSEREQFVDFDKVYSVPEHCLVIKIGDRKVALYPQKAIYQISIDGNYYQYEKKVAEIIDNQTLDSLMIRNLTTATWRGWNPKTRQLSDIPSGKEYPIFPGVLIEFQKDEPRIIGEIFDAKIK